MATLDEIKKVAQSLGNNFEQDGFVVFDNKCKTSFEGRVLIDYKGLRVVRMRKSQEQLEHISQGQLKQSLLMAMKNGKGDPAEILRLLKQGYENCSVCVLCGKDSLSDSAGEIVRAHIDDTSAYLF